MKHNLLKVALLLLPMHLLGRCFEPNNTQLNVGPLFNFARYKLGCLPKIEGYLAGVHTDLIYGRPYCAPVSDWYGYLRFDGRWNAGYVCGKDDLKSQIKDYRPEAAIGYNYCICDETTFITPFVGLGFYYLSNELKPDIITYKYNNLYVPIGADFYWRAKEHFQVEVFAEYRIDVWTRLKLRTPCVPICDKIKLSRTNGVHVEVPMTWFIDKEWCWCSQDFGMQAKVVPFFDWNRFGYAKEGNSEGLCYNVPKLQRWYLGLHIDIGVNF